MFKRINFCAAPQCAATSLLLAVETAKASKQSPVVVSQVWVYTKCFLTSDNQFGQLKLFLDSFGKNKSFGFQHPLRYTTPNHESSCCSRSPGFTRPIFQHRNNIAVKKGPFDFTKCIDREKHRILVFSQNPLQCYIDHNQHEPSYFEFCLQLKSIGLFE